MSSIRTALVLALAAFAGAALAAPLPVFAKDDPKAAKEAKDAEALKKRRNEYREKLKTKEGKLPFFDLSYAADPVKIKDTRWTQSDPPHPQAKEEDGMQLNATWSASQQQQGGIRVQVYKMIHKSLDGKSEFSYPFTNAGKQPKCADQSGMTEGFFLEWKKTMGDVVEKKCVEPKKSGVGPASQFASVIGTDKESQKRERRDVYTWLGPNATWVTLVTFSDKYLDDPAILAKAEEFIDSFKELKPPK